MTHRTEQRGRQTPSPDSSPEKTRFDARLVRGLDDDALAEFYERWKNSTVVRQAITKVLTKELDDAIIQSESKEVYELPNALAKLADLHAYRRGLRAAINLLTNQDPK